MIRQPTTIRQPGYYVVGNDIDFSGREVIRIQASDVVLDLGGYRISNDVGSGIRISDTAERVTVRHGIIELTGDTGRDESFCIRAGADELRVDGLACRGARISMVGGANSLITNSVISSARGPWLGPESRVYCNLFPYLGDELRVGDRSDVAYNVFSFGSFGAVTAGDGALIRGNMVDICGDECLVAGANSLVYDNSIVRHDLACGIKVATASIVEGNTVSGREGGASGICLTGEGSLARANVIHDVARVGVIVTGNDHTVVENQITRGFHGVEVQGERNLIDRNRITGRGDCGVLFRNAGDHVYRDNLLLGRLFPTCGPPNIDAGGNIVE